ncbi:hypothetical protein ACE0DR_29105 [Azotobacter sp. CWF10]
MEIKIIAAPRRALFVVFVLFEARPNRFALDGSGAFPAPPAHRLPAGHAAGHRPEYVHCLLLLFADKAGRPENMMHSCNGGRIIPSLNKQVPAAKYARPRACSLN